MNVLNKVFQELEKVNQIILGKPDHTKLMLIALLSKGHVLLEDVPGVGKTSLVKVMAKFFDLQFNRVQFTNDLLPSDILGVNIFDLNSKQFNFHKGPVFTQILLADELNRTSARTQSALLQVMEEREVTLDGKTMALDEDFIVMATQNPRQQIGTNNLPESQLDRFLIKISLGFTNKDSEIELLKGENRARLINSYKSKLNLQDLHHARSEVEKIHISEAIYSYIYELLNFSRENLNAYSLSTRCGRDLVLSCKALAWLESAQYVTVDHVKKLFPSIAGHRLVDPNQATLKIEQKISNEILETVNVH